jgi:hypothetical protein
MHAALRQDPPHCMRFLCNVVNDGALTRPKDIQLSNSGNVKSKLASRQRRDYDVSTQNHHNQGFI